MPDPLNDRPRSVPSPSDLDRLIRRDQLAALRLSMSTAIPINMALGLVGMIVAIHAGQGAVGATWFAASTAANLLRLALCRVPCAALSPRTALSAEAAARSVDRHLRLVWMAAWLSGLVWAFLPALCAGCTAAQTVFYLTLTCGTTAGAVTYGTAFARMPIGFFTPPLLSFAGCLLVAGGFDRICLAATVLLYLAAMIRGAFLCEAGFREASRLKNEASALAQSRMEAHASASALALEMARRATHDDLTGLLNRAGFQQDADAALRGDGALRGEAALRDDAAVEPVAHCLMLLDLDGFKSVNDVHGHTMGDRVLAEVARRMAAALPPGSLAARLGGDEFAVLYAPAPAGIAQDVLAARLIGAVAEPFESLDAGRLGISIGIHQGDAGSLTHRLSCADEALYAAKGAGRNRARLFDECLRDRMETRRDSERDLSQALAEGVVTVCFQPIFGRDGRTLVSLEALVRWNHPRHGWIPPADVVAAAATAGLTESLLRAILEQACAMVATLCRHGLETVQVALNVSPREMAQIAVDEIVLGRLAALGLPPRMLEIEITEETALDIGAVQAKLTALAEAGIRVTLDDFGIGYSSLASLRQLQAHRIKIDRSFVTGLTGSDDKCGLVQAVLALGRWLDIEVVAEGVETADDLATLQAFGCTLFQGYHLGRPMSAEAVADLLASQAGARMAAA